MIRTTFLGDDTFILNDPPNWMGKFESTFSAITDLQDGLTKIEARRPYTMFLRSALKFTITLSDDALINFQGVLRLLQDQNVVVPFWPALEFWSFKDGQAIGGGLYLVWKQDWSQWELYRAGEEPVWPGANDFVAPAVMGFFKTTTNNAISPTSAHWAFEFIESSPANYALMVTPDMMAARFPGPKPSTYNDTPYIFPFTPDWSNVSEDLRVTVKRSQMGFERPSESTFYPHDVYRVNESDYTLSDQGVFQILEFFGSVASQGSPFWTVGAFVNARLANPSLAADTSLVMVDASGLFVGDYIAYVSDPASTTILWGKITAIVSNTVTISAAFGVALPAGWQFMPLSLARLDKPQLKLTWTSLTMVKAKMIWSEVRPEKAIPASETINVTTGQLPARATIFHFVRDFGNGTVTNWYFTSAEVDIFYAGKMYLARGIALGEVVYSLNMENDSAKIDTFTWADNPLLDDISLQAEAPLSVSVTHLEFNGSDWLNPTQVFTGDCTSLSRSGSKISAQCKFGTSIFETELPRFVRGQMCNNIGGSNNDGSFLISAGCTLLKSAWKFSATVATPIANTFPFTLKIAALAGVGADAITALGASAVFLNWFANGWIEWGAGANVQRRMIIGSSVPVAGAVTLTLHKYFKSLPSNGDAVVLYPGCDGLYVTCQAYNSVTNPTGKFNNRVNFGGEPFTPIANPSANNLPDLNTQGSKK